MKLLQRSLGITFVFVTHAQSEALALSDRIVVMNQGKVEQISPPYELYTRPRSLFVAQFIGRNTLVPGTVRSMSGNLATVDTAFGPLSGLAPAAAASPGAKANLVLPAEAIDVLPASAPQGELEAAYGSCVIPVSITRLQQVGHLVQMAVALPNGEQIGIEGHADKYGGRFSAGDKAHVAWMATGATVIIPEGSPMRRPSAAELARQLRKGTADAVEVVEEALRGTRLMAIPRSSPNFSRSVRSPRPRPPAGG